VRLDPPLGTVPRAFSAHPRSADRRGWLVHGLVALTISALGLGAAASTALPTSAEPRQGTAGVEVRTGASQPAPESVPLVGPGASTPAPRPDRPSRSGPVVAAAFAPQLAPAEPADEQVRVAVVKERAAQRAEALSRQAEDATRLTRTASKQARAKNLAATDREIRETAVRIATERRQRAIAARVAAEVARKKAEAAALSAADQGATTTTPSPPSVDTSTIPYTANGFSPVPGAVVGTPFHATGLWARYHTGLDFRAASGTPIRAVQSGVVLYAGNSGNWAGNHVAILHANGVTTMSSHMSAMAVRAGDQVRAGQVIGRVGATGRAFGAHLHFEVYPRGVKYGDIYSAVNPLPWLRANGVQTR